MKKFLLKNSEINIKIMERIEKLLPEELIGKRDVIQRRYKCIYGNENFEEKIRLYRMRNLKRIILLIAAIFLVTLGFIGMQVGGDNYLVTNELGEITAIKPPQDHQIIIPMEIGILVEGREKKEPITFSSPKTIGKEDTENNNNDLETSRFNKDEKYKKAQREARLYIKSLGESQPRDIYYLPRETEDGEQIAWYIRESRDELLLILLLPLLFVFVYRSRYRELTDEEIRLKKIVQIELSEFITKLILLLDAGLVMSAAFQKIVRDYEWAVKEEKLPANYFYQQLAQINHTLQEAKGSFPQELKEFAHRTRIPEFIRLANIITDNYQIGSELVEKLTMEGEMLWFTRKKIAVEQGKLAEIKLSLPLMLLILSLLVITIAPVLLEM